MTARLAALLLLTLSWLAVTGSVSLPNVVLGLLLAAAVLFVLRERMPARAAPIVVRPLALARLAGLFLYELVLSAWRVAVVVLSPRMDLRPGIFAYPLTVDRDFEIALLANLITLTPGTLSVDVSDDRRTLFVHALDCADKDAAVRDIRNGFERLILESLR